MAHFGELPMGDMTSSPADGPSTSTNIGQRGMWGLGNMPFMIKYWLLESSPGALDHTLIRQADWSSSHSRRISSSLDGLVPLGSSIAESFGTGGRTWHTLSANIDLDLLGIASFSDGDPE